VAGDLGQVPNVLRRHLQEQSEVVATIEVADLDEHVMAEESGRANDDADQLAIVEEHILDGPQLLTAMADHHVLAMPDLDIAIRFGSDLVGETEDRADAQ
jgi:hypothetical protein